MRGGRENAVRDCLLQVRIAADRKPPIDHQKKTSRPRNQGTTLLTQPQENHNQTLSPAPTKLHRRMPRTTKPGARLGSPQNQNKDSEHETFHIYGNPYIMP